MRAITSLLLLLSILLPLSACSPALPAEQTQETVEQTTTAPPKKEESQKEERVLGEIDLPDTFSVGYDRQDISPTEFPIIIYDKHDYAATSNRDPIQLTCTALSDGESIVLLVGIDIKTLPESFANYSLTLINKATGVPKENIFLNATHIHYGPDPTLFGLDSTIKNWQKLYYERLVDAAIGAIEDLTPAEAYAGVSHTEGVTFVRRYLLADGTYKTNPSKANEPIAHETEADTEMRVIRFAREGKKDVVMVNYQTHYGSSTPTQVSADFVHPFREQVEAELNCHFAYLNGASGNLNFISALPGERKYPDIEAAAPALVQTVKRAIAAEAPMSTGKIAVEKEDYLATTKGNWKKPIPLSAVSCGDLGFVAAPYEMFDTNGQEIRAASPCKMTFVCAYTNGSFGYVPSALAFGHGAYEVEITQFEEGSGEEFAKELLHLLNLCKAK